jgi:hypothetical protein
MSTRRPTQQCPICGAVQPLAAQKCSICGAVLPGERTPIVTQTAAEDAARRGARARYDSAVGDDDLYAGDLSGRMWRLLAVGGVVLALVLGLGLGYAVSRIASHGGDGSSRAVGSAPTAPPTATPRATVITPTLSPTPPITLDLPTVTPQPPTATVTPSPTPCYQKAQQGDTVLGMAYRCGHLSTDVVPLILEINNLNSPQELKIGQTLEIPWPTPTLDPNATQPSTALPVDAGTGGGGDTPDATSSVVLNEFGTPDALANYAAVEATLRPGLAWHTVRPGQTILDVAFEYGTTLETLSKINPEVPFLQCDFGSGSGGPDCVVMLYEGQRVRVPVPLPTGTPSPTPVGTLTPTPTATPTFNAPYLLSPEDDAIFRSDQMVTLRWGGTGTLGADERYLVQVRDLDSGETHQVLVRDTTYILPGGWQPSDRKLHHFDWTVSVATVDAQNDVLNENHVTESRRFTWDSR